MLVIDIILLHVVANNNFATKINKKKKKPVKTPLSKTVLARLMSSSAFRGSSTDDLFSNSLLPSGGAAHEVGTSDIVYSMLMTDISGDFPD